MFYIVPTPIGNREDITLRALNILKDVDAIICEDTRVTGKLLAYYQIKKPLYVYNDHSDIVQRQNIINKLQEGKKLALVSDAGTPLISDPGYKLLKQIKENEIEIICLPGACSIITALISSSMPTDRFMFHGFLENKKIARINQLKELKHYDLSMIFFESPRRLIATLSDMREVFMGREVAVIRELTKKFEEVITSDFDSAIKHYSAKEIKGEIIIIVSPIYEKQAENQDVEQRLSELLENLSIKDAVSAIDNNSAYSKKELYKMALRLKNVDLG
ncbi:Ribosomal RNA small subunit methyltransferase I [Candidatus Arcanobacter lacustris]|uniref:Ribosomal RNA small subunit methyltransferase I n=1 Tax=Candidatus Arcanibacter lacustris TaxID=1607817 RepID=A0A0F5MQJ5_9RICK|nr:Ribosomal RNA small subunit methyltransferase I [Candidatus Arcanobacter lacustris]